MAKLVYEPIPENRRRSPAYMQYVALVEEFLESGQPSARVDDEIGQSRLVGRLKCAIDHSKASGHVAVRQRKQVTYLERV